jgi:hypothetical protein
VFLLNVGWGGVGWGCRNNVFIEGLRDWESERGTSVRRGLHLCVEDSVGKKDVKGGLWCQCA